MTLKQWMEDNEACILAIEWANTLTVEQAWLTCPRADWMLWALAKAKFPKIELVRLCVEIARTVQHLNKDPQVSHYLDITEAWCDGKASLKEVEKARKEVYNSTSTSASTYYATAYYATAYAATSTYYAASAYAAASINAAAEATGNREVALKTYADLIRTRVPVETVLKLVSG
jgi:hypothetical protein